MNVLKSGLLALFVSGLAGSLAVAGCSASTVTDALPTDDDDTNGNVIGDDDDDQQGDDDDDEPATDAGKKDSGSKDSGTKDATTDTGVLVGPDTGTACTNTGKPFVRSCGNCGKQTAYCFSADGGADGVVGEYTACDEINDKCAPGTTLQETCGNCGMVTKTCNAQCKYVAGQCTGQPANNCSPGTVQYQKASCSGSQYVSASCNTMCTWNAFNATCATPPNVIEVNGSVGKTSSTIVFFSEGKTIAKPTGTCTSTSGPSIGTIITPYTYTEVKNTTGKTAELTFAHALAPDGVTLNTVMGVYAGSTPPSTDAQRKVCVSGFNSNYSGFAKIDGTSTSYPAVTVGPGQSVTVYSAQYNAYSATVPANGAGPLLLQVTTKSLN